MRYGKRFGGSWLKGVIREMSELDLPYTVFIIVDRRTIALTEHLIADDERLFKLEIDEASIGEVCFPVWEQPKIAVSHSHLVVWGGMRVYIVPLKGGALHQFKQEEPIDAAYPIGSLWCFVCELSVRFFDPAKGGEVARFEHNEVLMRSWWSGDSLVVEDFEGRRIRFKSLAVGSELSAQYE